jgi:penicillin-binding protein 2
MTIRTESDREQIFSRRALFIGAVQGGIGLMLAGRMAYLSVFERDKYELLAEDNRVSVRLIPPRRGWIVDRNGKPLALNRPDYRLELVPEQVDDLEATLAQIARVIPITAEDLARVRADAKKHPGYVPVEVVKDMPWEQFAALNVRMPELAGVQPIRGYARHYPDGTAFGHLLGYVAAPTREQFLETKDPLYVFPGFRIGKDGIEKMLDERLRGTAGARRSEVNARGRIIRDLDTVDDKQGATVKLTIDRDLQAYAARRLGDESASVIVMDCWTGDLLCMLSMPAFDPNAFSDGISHTEWNTLTGDDHHPLINKTVQGWRSSTPGSSRPTAAAAPAATCSAAMPSTATSAAATATSTCRRAFIKAATPTSTISAAWSGSTASPRWAAASAWGRSSTCRSRSSAAASSPTKHGR